MPTLDALSAASHANPYPYYQQLLAGPALAFDPGLQLWIASRASVIEAVFDNPHCQVRPPGESVPGTIAASHAGAVFGRLMRMNEGAAHRHPRQIVKEVLDALDIPAIERSASRLAALPASAPALPHAGTLGAWMEALPAYVIADLLGVAGADLPAVARETAAFVRCLSPLSSEQQLAEASVAAAALQARFGQLARRGGAAPGLQGALWRSAARHGGVADDALIANVIGLLSQSHEATAGLIGNCIVALLTAPPLQARLRADPTLTAALVREVARHDAPVQQTRRFVAQATSVAGVELPAGATIVLLLAAAGRDEGAHVMAGALELQRAPAALAGFGHGRHACPGQALALLIAGAALRHLLALPAALDAAVIGWRYRPSLNARLPEFFPATSAATSAR